MYIYRIIVLYVVDVFFSFKYITIYTYTALLDKTKSCMVYIYIIIFVYIYILNTIKKNISLIEPKHIVLVTDELIQNLILKGTEKMPESIIQITNFCSNT